MAPSIPASHRDLLDQDVMVLATLGPDGRPQLSAVWFLATDGKIQISLNTDRQKVRNLLANPTATAFLLDPDNSQRYLEVRADVRIEDDPGYEFAGRVGQKYHADLRAFDGPGATRVAVTLEPVRVNAVDLSQG